jgi:hypothetical protein
VLSVPVRTLNLAARLVVLLVIDAVVMLYSWLVFACGNQQPTVGLQPVQQSTQSLGSGALWAMPRRQLPGKTPDV